MNSIILVSVARLLTGVLLIFSVFLLIRGHNLPGGGFSGGLVAGCAFVLYGLANGFPAARRLLGISPRLIIGGGLTIAIWSGLLGMLAGKPFLTGLWLKTPLPVIGKVGTPWLFDVGVYFTVLGITTLIVFSLAEDTEEED
jgi:multicomponent Na+:H+ antiporter subunit B